MVIINKQGWMVEQPKRKHFIKRAARWISTLGSCLLIAAAVALLLAVVPVFGNKALIVRSGSMEPTIGVGDLVIVRQAPTYHAGEVIAFRGVNADKIIVTHRIAEVRDEGLVTKGDANDSADGSVVTMDRVLGRQVLTVPHVGRALAFGKTKSGFLAFIVVPALLMITGDVMVIARELRGKRARRAVPFNSPAVTKRAPAKVTLGQVGQVPLLNKQKFNRVLSARLYVDSVMAKVLLLVFSVGLIVPSGLALYADSESSTENTFAVAACFETDGFGDEVVEVGGTGTYGDCCNAAALATGTERAEELVTGAPDSPPNLNFIQISDGTSVTIKFSNNKGVLSGDGDSDLRIHTYDNPFPGEAEVFVSDNCSAFMFIGTVFDNNEPLNYVDIDVDGFGVSSIKCVKLVDLAADGDSFPTLGFDLDAIEVLHSAIQCESEELASAPSPSPDPSSSPSPSPSLLPSPSPSPTPGLGDVVINEVMWMGSHDGNSAKINDEWIELRNMTSNTVDVSGWKIDKAGSGASQLVIPTGESIGPNGYYLISHYNSDHSSSAIEDSIVVDFVEPSIDLHNNGEQLVLRDADGEEVDSMPVPVGSTWAKGINNNDTPLKQSMARNASPLDGTISDNWHTCTNVACNDTTYWDTEGSNYGTPRAANL